METNFQKADNVPCALILQAEKAVEQVLAYKLKSIGCRVIISQSVHQAAEMLKNGECVDVIIIEMMMPGMNVLDFVDGCLETPRFQNIAIFFLTYYNITSALRKRLHHAQVFYFQKPFDPRELIDEIQKKVRNAD